MPTSRYPKATWLGNGQSGGSYTSGPWKVVLHTTETSGLPGYENGAYAPHLTYSPLTRAFYQHTSFLTAARALKNEAGGVQTNRDSALQLEIICYSNKYIADTYNRLWVGDLSDENLADIREFLEWAHEWFGVKLEWPGKRALSYSEANAPGFRMSGAEWDSFNGVCAHQHLPENVHWDTGALDWSKLILEDILTPEQEARIIAAIEATPVKVWGVKVQRSADLVGNPTPNGISAIQELADAKTVAVRTEAALGGVRQTVDLTKAQVAGLVTAVSGISAVAGATAPEIVAEIGRLLSGG